MRPTLTVILTLTAFGLLAGTAPAAQAQAPANDNYLDSLRLNEPGKRLERTDTLRDSRNTANASLQGDVFAPPRSGGPAEVTTCGASSYGKTIWYDFYPDVPGLARIRASGFNSVISVIPFSGATGTPNFGARRCINDSSSTTEELLAEVEKRRSYTIQLGGVNGASGNLELLFDFLADTDGDRVLDDVDKCDRFKGTTKNSGCPVELRAKALLRARPIAGGIEVVGLSVNASKGSRVSATCTRGCRGEVKRAKSTVRFRRIRGKQLRAGSKIVLRVTRKRAIGAYISFRVTNGNFKRTERCLNPGSRKPRRKCG